MCRIKEFSEWAQCIVLELVSKYAPPDSNEIFDIMNLLEDRLQHANGAVVLATIKLFLQLTLSMTDVHQQVPIPWSIMFHELSIFGSLFPRLLLTIVQMKIDFVRDLQHRAF